MKNFLDLTRSCVFNVASFGSTMGLKRRQVFRLLERLRSDGAGGLVSRKSGRPSNRRQNDAFREQIVDIVREHYPDLGPTLARDYLIERDGITVACETLRQLMIQAGLWKDRAVRRPRHYQPRYSSRLPRRADPGGRV